MMHLGFKACNWKIASFFVTSKPYQEPYLINLIHNKKNRIIYNLSFMTVFIIIIIMSATNKQQQQKQQQHLQQHQEHHQQQHHQQ